MTKRLILARHGNTFAPEEKPVWVGARSDLPLVEKGIEQAHLLANALFKMQIALDMVLAGPLQRTKQTAEIVVDALQIPHHKLKIDPRLTEIDYGTWEGKSTEEIIELRHEQQLNDWNTKSIVPTDANWQPSEEELTSNINQFLEDTGQGTTLVVTSNGILRFFARAAYNANTISNFKVLPGHGCMMHHDGKTWTITAWNQPPDLLLH